MYTNHVSLWNLAQHIEGARQKLVKAYRRLCIVGIMQKEKLLHHMCKIREKQNCIALRMEILKQAFPATEVQTAANDISIY